MSFGLNDMSLEKSDIYLQVVIMVTQLSLCLLGEKTCLLGVYN